MVGVVSERDLVWQFCGWSGSKITLFCFAMLLKISTNLRVADDKTLLMSFVERIEAYDNKRMDGSRVVLIAKKGILSGCGIFAGSFVALAAVVDLEVVFVADGDSVGDAGTE